MTTTRTHPLIPLTAVDAVHKPIAQAKGMPREVYTDAGLFEFERDNVVGKSWAGIAFTSELPNNGYLKPVDFMGLPLVVMRNRDGEFKVFHNVCSHRGMRLVTQETEVKKLVRCPYHSWSYDLEGKLKTTPHIGGFGVHSAPGFDCAQHGLKAVRSAVRMGILFVNLSADAEEFDSFIEPLERRWEEFVGTGGFDKTRLAPTGSHWDLEINANWKLAVENYCEAYHLPWVHPALNKCSPLDQHYNLVVNENMSGQGSYAYNLSAVADATLPKFEGWPTAQLQQAEYISLYPNILLGLQADHLFTIILQPLAHNHTLEKLQLAFVGEEANADEFAACRAAVLESWRIVFSEDVFAVEGMQAGRNSPAFEGGVFSPVLDGPSHHFHGWIAQRYADAIG